MGLNIYKVSYEAIQYFPEIPDEAPEDIDNWKMWEEILSFFGIDGASGYIYLPDKDTAIEQMENWGMDEWARKAVLELGNKNGWQTTYQGGN